ncbi:primosomal protein DnaI [Haploplasma modicum]|uniref:primosomal protein DnaI n=1 Tax=Haploplasma modicum TaxID=2150 RepID=UPI00214C6B95|nr:primosomal protein DnaI [Haploplasma modicum]MCR1808734.1 primosomal protein DnaI [Haploplasma modicum]
MSLKDIRDRVKNDLETKDLILDDNDLMIVDRYLNIRDQIKDGYKPILKTDPYIEIVYIPTKERLEEEKLSKLKNNLLVFESDIYLQDADIENFEIFNDEREKIKKIALDFVKNYDENVYQKGLYIYGKYRTGKTYILSAIANHLAKNDCQVLLVFMPDLVRTIKQGISDGTMESKINLLKQTEVLMIDDIGGENITAWFRDEILLPILQYRLSAKLTTFFSSNLDYNNLTQSLSQGSKTEHDFVKAVRVIQRIRELTTYIKLDDKQYK